MNDAVCGDGTDVELEQKGSTDLFSEFVEEVSADHVVGVLFQSVAVFDHIEHSFIVVLNDFARLDETQGHVYDLILSVVGQLLEIFVHFLEQKSALLPFGLHRGCFLIEEKVVFDGLQFVV